jgi:hypothetical protein
MLSLESEYRELRAAGVIEDALASRSIAVERGEVFSVSEELRVSMYAAVAAITAGVGLLLKAHLDRIGPLALVMALGAAAAGCYATAIRTRLRGETRSTAGDYLLLLGALMTSADLGYAESQFHWLGQNWSWHLLILFALHAGTAYVMDSRMVLSLALTSLAAWFGVQGDVVKSLEYGEALARTGDRALICAAVIVGWREIHRRSGAIQPFREVFEHFAANLGFWGALALCFESGTRLGGLACAGALAFVTIRHGLRRAREIFVIYGIGYSAVALLGLEMQLMTFGLQAAVMQLATVLAAVSLMWRLHREFKAPPP